MRVQIGDAPPERAARTRSRRKRPLATRPDPSKMRRRGEATEFALDEPGEGNCGAIV